MKISYRKMAVAVLLLCLWLCGATKVYGQVDRGAIVGTVTDASSASVSGAKIVVTNLETNQVAEFTTDEEGKYSAPLLKIGKYSVRVEKQGFASAVENNVDVSVNQVARVDVMLKVGAASELVEVTAAAPLLQTETSSLGTIETERRITDLPLNGRNFIQLAYLGPGANSGVTGSNVSGGVFENERANEAISVNGLSVSNNNFLLNGVDNNEFGLGGVIILPPPDAIQEFRTETNSMAAEFGRGGAAVNVVTKSGTNQVHGGVFEFIRNDVLDAQNYFSGGQQLPFKRNQFGAFVGFPIKKDKTFLFVDYSGSRLRESAPFLSTVPTDAERTGDFSGILGGQATDSDGSPIFDAIGRPVFVNEVYDPTSLKSLPDGTLYRDGFGFDPITGLPIPGQANIIPACTDGSLPGGCIDQVGKNVMNFYPPATDQTTATNNYLATQKHVNSQDAFDVRFDHRFSEADQIFAAYSFGDIRSERPAGLGNLGGESCCPSKSNSRAQHVGIGYTHVFSPRVMNDLHGGYFRYAVNALPFNYGKNLGEQLGIPNANRGDLNSSGLTNIDISGATSLGDSLYLPEHAFENIYQIADTVTWVRGKHSLKFGMDFRRQQRNFYQVTAPRGYFAFSGLYTADPSSFAGGVGLADLMLGVAQQTEQDFLPGIYPTRYWDLAEFVQDDYRVKSNLTINIGLRYEVTSPANGRLSNFDLKRGVLVSSYGPHPVPHAGVNFDTSNIAPRVGFAWSLPRNTVVRSAFGIFYSAQGNIFDDLGLNPPQLTFIQNTYSPGSTPQVGQLISTGFPDALPAFNPDDIQGPLKTTGSTRMMPKILEWNLTVQHQFGQNWVAEVGYVGTHAYRLWNHEASDLNQPPQPLDTNFCGPDTSNCTAANFGRPYFSTYPNVTAILPLDYAERHLNYNSFQASLNKRFANGFNLLAAYTFAKSLGNTDGNVGSYIQDSHHPNAEYGPVSPDLRHRLSISYLYELPVGKGRTFGRDMNSIADAMIGGWQVGGITTVQSGEAETAALSGDVSNTGSFSPRPNQIHDPNDFSFQSDTATFTDVYGCTPGKQTLTCWYNPLAFAIPDLAPGQNSAHQFGNSTLGNLRGPDLVTFDFVLQKNFRIRESQQIEFRAEFFNIFNHPNFGLPATNPDVPGGNSITNTSIDNRQIEFALKYTF
jgi:Carboxypeptidase regulatory-like domain